MKKIILTTVSLLLAIGFSCLSACTSQSALKSEALKDAKIEFHAALIKEMEGQLTPSSGTGNNFLTYTENHSDFEVNDIKMEGENNAIVRVQLETIPKKNRTTLIKIAGNLDPVKTPNFNMGNAINLIEQQPGQVKGKEIQILILKFHKSGESWIYEAPTP
jgi:hypothetical protein